MRTQFLLISAAAGALAAPKPCKAPSKAASVLDPLATVSVPTYGSGSGSELTTPEATTKAFSTSVDISLSVPSGSIPAGSVPSDSVPKYSALAVTTPEATTKAFPTSVDMSVSMPSVAVPTGSMPSVSMPSAEIPTGSMPSYSMPSAAVPTGSIPSASVPGYGSGGEATKTPFTTAVATTIGFPSGSFSMPTGSVVFTDIPTGKGGAGMSMSLSMGAGASPTGSGSTGGNGGAGMSLSMGVGAGASPTGYTGGNGGAGMSLSMGAGAGATPTGYGSTGGNGGSGMSLSMGAGVGATPTGAGGAQSTGGLGMGGGLGGNGGLGAGNGGSAGTCSAPKIAGGLFDFLGDLSLNGGMSFSSKSGKSCNAGVFAGAKSKRTIGSLTSAAGKAGGILGVGEGILGGSVAAGESVAGSILGGASAEASGLLSGSASLLTGIAGGVAGGLASEVDAGLAAIFAGSNFLQIGGEVAGALGSLCQTAPLCKGKKYTISIEGACGMTGDVSMLWQIGGMAGLTSPITKLTGGMSAKASMSFDFTWESDDLLTVPLCLLSTIAQEGQVLGLTGFNIVSKL